MIRHDAAGELMGIRLETVDAVLKAPSDGTAGGSVAVERGHCAGAVRDELHGGGSLPDQQRQIAPIQHQPFAPVRELETAARHVGQLKEQNGGTFRQRLAIQ